MIRALAYAGLVLALIGCQSRGPGPSGTVSSAPAAMRGLRVAVVDLERVARAHPRWPELEALDRRIAELQAELTLPPGVQVQRPQIDLAPQMRAEVERELAQMRPEFRRQFEQEAASLQEAARRELAAYVEKVRADGHAEFEAKRKALEAQIMKAVQDTQQETTKEMEQFEQQTMQQYRIPLLNLRLKIETVQQTEKEEADRLNAQLQALTKERDDKIAEHDKVSQKALQEVQQQQTARYNAAAADLEKQFIAEGQRLVDQKAKELTARVHDQLAAKEKELNTELNARLKTDIHAREQALVAGAREQVLRAQEQATTAARERVQALRAQLQAVEAQRARLLGSLIAEARVDAAALAQEKGYDVILTKALGTFGAVDVTDDLIARIKR